MSTSEDRYLRYESGNLHVATTRKMLVEALEKRNFDRQSNRRRFPDIDEFVIGSMRLADARLDLLCRRALRGKQAPEVGFTAE